MYVCMHIILYASAAHENKDQMPEALKTYNIYGKKSLKTPNYQSPWPYNGYSCAALVTELAY